MQQKMGSINYVSYYSFYPHRSGRGTNFSLHQRLEKIYGNQRSRQTFSLTEEQILLAQLTSMLLTLRTTVRNNFCIPMVAPGYSTHLTHPI